MKIIQKISAHLSVCENLPRVYAIIICCIAVFGVCTTPYLIYHDEQLYPKSIDITSPLNPYDRGGVPMESAQIIPQYPDNSPSLGYITAYLTPASRLLANTTMYLGTTIVAHPGGILDEILYYTRGLDTIVEASIFFMAFAIASFLYRRKEE